VRRTAEHYTLLDAHLQNNAYVVGNAFSMGDIPLGAVTHRWFALDIERPTLSAVNAWYQRLTLRPAFMQHVNLPLS